MPKMKVHKGLKKRVRLTAKGKVKHKRRGTSHLMSGTSGKKLKELNRPKIAPKAVAKTIGRCLGGINLTGD